MLFDLSKIAPMRRYELLLGTVVPRPIALVTSLSRDGLVNAAPYSLFNVMSHDPPIVAFSVLPSPLGQMKDTGQNILAGGDFVVNLVSEALAEAMNLTCIDAPADVSETDLAGLATIPSTAVAPPRLQASPVALECRFVTSLTFGPKPDRHLRARDPRARTRRACPGRRELHRRHTEAQADRRDACGEVLFAAG